MKHLSVFWPWVATLWLAGCAAPPSAPPVKAPAAAASAPAPVSQISLTPPGVSAPALKAPVYPTGGLRQLSAAPVDAWTVHALVPPLDIWDRIRRGFAMPDLQGELVDDRVQWYRTRPDYIARMTERGRKYLFHVVEELERRNMPTELALLPFVESAFNPEAVSSAKAAGMWQFMPATGRNFELKQNMFRDDRRDVLASTRAALDYLQKLHDMFGDWHLALAAYNWGEGSVMRAIAKNQKLGLGTAYTDLKMPMETRFYVPKLQAIKNIVATPESLNVSLPVIGNHPFFQTVDIRRDMDVAVAARLAEVSLQDFRALNPSASKPVLLAAGTPQILLPWDNATLFQRNLEAYTGGRLASWTAWVATTTLKPADAARRFDMSEAELRAVNAIPPRMLIRAGSTLLVRRGNALHTDVSEHIADNGQLSLAPETVLRRQLVKAGKKDSVASLAKKYGVSVANLADWNNTSEAASFKPGQKITLYLPARARSTAARSSRSTTRKPVSRTTPASQAKVPKKKSTRKK